MLPTQKSVPKTDFLKTKTCIVGNPKVGKTTFASQLGDNVLFLATEKGYDFLSIYAVDINNWADYENVLKSLRSTKHNYQTLVIDVVDRLIEFAEAEICKRNEIKSGRIADIPFGDGYKGARNLLIESFESIEQMGLGLTIVTHPKEKEYLQEAIKWTAMGTTLPNSYEKKILGYFDLILYAYVNQQNQRMIRTKPNKFILCAGDRSAKLPETMPLDPNAVKNFLSLGPTVAPSLQQAPPVTSSSLSPAGNLSGVKK